MLLLLVLSTLQDNNHELTNNKISLQKMDNHQACRPKLESSQVCQLKHHSRSRPPGQVFVQKLRGANGEALPSNQISTGPGQWHCSLV
jgi:hypothetical protein